LPFIASFSEMISFGNHDTQFTTKNIEMQ